MSAAVLGPRTSRKALEALVAQLQRENADLHQRLAARRPEPPGRLWLGEGIETKTGRAAASAVAYHCAGQLRCYRAFKPEFDFEVHTLDAPTWLPIGGVRHSHYGDDGIGVAFASDESR